MMKRLADRFFGWFCHPDYFDEIQGDLEEMYRRDVGQSERFTHWKHLLRVLGLFRPSLVRAFSIHSLTKTNPTMFRHYFHISTRVLLRHKFYAAMNILGLAVGMGIALLIYQYIHFELSYDRFHADAENIYRLTRTVIRNGEELGNSAYTTYAFGPTGKESIPEVEEVVRVHPDEVGLIVINEENNQRHQEGSMWYVDSTFLQMFNYPLKYGDPASALNDQHSIVITEPMATKYFGNSNPVGKPLRVSGGVLSGDFVVTGVLKPLPANGHLQFDFLLPIAFLLSHWGPYKNHDDGWSWEYFATYVKLHESTDPNEVSEKYDRLVVEHTGEELAKSNTRWEIGLQPLTDIHLQSNFPKDLANNPGSVQNIRFFALIAVFILLIAWVNYINLSTARAMHRAKEVGVRKSVGALKTQLVGQFLAESFLTNTLAALLAVGIAWLALPVLNNIVGQQLSLSVLLTTEFWMGFLLIALLGSLLSGLYPAFVLSSFHPTQVLKSIRITPQRGFSLRRGLITFQFLTSVLLISGTYLVYQQISFMKNQHLGYDIKKVLVVNGPRVVIDKGQEVLFSKYETFRNEVATHATVSSVSLTSHIPAHGYLGEWNVRKLGEPESKNKTGYVIFADTSFTDTYDIEFLAKKEFPAVINDYERLIINEATVKMLGLGSPEEAVGEQLLIFGDTSEVLGVVPNIHWSSLREAPRPMLLSLDNHYGAYLSIKMNLSNIPETIAHIEDTYRSIYPEDPFTYFFLDDSFNRQYQADVQFGNLFSAFSALAIFIACIGLFALVSYSATLRIKEIGIRKVLGARVSHLMLLLSREYLILLLIAIALAVPIVFIGGKAWLNNYAFKTDIGLDLLVIPASVLVLISVLTVSYRTYTTANKNPVDSLRTE